MLRDYISDKKYVNADRVLEIRYEEFKLDPMETVKAIYSKFNYKDLDSLIPDLKAFLESLSNHKPGKYSISKE